ncbi:mechanosensitive ion channel family protein [Halpernia frigidisoli]|uniref:Miniconductance mechanosensitive channel n=1 Tax=Halpernia frigidisoli TaxID=1125876 RepID=A0A1I3FG31_9FLAO|nr:mechanosensitive ion channel domain-containing protein [Halpernia frigidisoli]SFI10165.1 miniconductance mechanosensitive channel [Halpernia frigidisoli]
MGEDLITTKDFLQDISDQIHYFVKGYFPEDLVLWMQIIAKFLLLAALIFLVSNFFKIIFKIIFKFFVNEERFPILTSIYKSRITTSIARLIAIFIGSYALYSIFYRHPKSFDFLEIIIKILFILVLGSMIFKMLKAVEFYYLWKKDFYMIMALRAINQTVKIFGIFIFSIISLSILFKISGSAILGSLGAITAVLVLVFRDTILGFVTGIHVATSKNLKVNDWIGIPKYNLEGTIMDINLLTTKILNFDKTVSTIPTYDLLSTEIKNLQVMSETNTRRIKKSIYFNINSFKFIDEELLNKLKDINLISEYLTEKTAEISESKKNMSHFDKTINGAQLTNIGVFRYYVIQYLTQNKNVDNEGTLLVRQMEITPQGLPLEIYCFTNDSKWEHFEQIQADIFDHILVAAKEFDLQVIQYTKN